MTFVRSPFTIWAHGAEALSPSSRTSPQRILFVTFAVNESPTSPILNSSSGLATGYSPLAMCP